MAGSHSTASRDGLARKERAEKIALFRYQLIREAADDSVTTRQRGPMVKALAATVHPGPFGGTIQVSKDTIDRWIRAWRVGGFDGLKPKPRAQGMITPEQVLSLAAVLKREKPARTSAQVRRIMIDTLGDAPSESTLLRHFRTLDIPTGVREVFGRFEADHPNELWVGDGLHGPRIGGRKTYLFAFLDDHSRLVTAARWAFAEDSVRLSAALRPALQSRGIPGIVYVDNGSAFADESLARTCARLGIRLTHSKPYRPQGRGKIERFFNTVTSQFLTEITPAGANKTDDVKPATGATVQDTAGTTISSLEELNALFSSWVEMVYHQAIHSTTGQTPLARWDTGWANRRPDRRDPDIIAEAFRWSAHRTVTKSATVSLQPNIYQVDPLLAGKRVELIYDPFDLTGAISVSAAGGVPAGEAVLLEIRRHVHHKAAKAVNDADTGAVNASSGIDYLRMVADRHKDTMVGAPISFDKIAAGTTNTASTTGTAKELNI
ncbi:DDE-type integrase/transposase/recombinase [Arthrobacter sp. A5]|uniref:DDE-type integrase/transposase/recombinase n=1 Tax=Arthrobacter sp. A5 TaxID=576926 RepID=UPI003DAA140C